MNEHSETDPLKEPGTGESSVLVGDADDLLIKGHKYDGIKEYDNPMPGWWVWMFIGSIVFSVIYVAGLHVFDFVDSYEEDLAEGVANLEVRRATFAGANPTFEVDEASLLDLVSDDGAVAAGSKTFAQYCAACHAAQAQGLIGPNLTDNYWIHGGTPIDIFNVVTTGVAAKGMPAWDGTLTPEERAHVVAYILSVQGTAPPNAKEPQGEQVL